MTHRFDRCQLRDYVPAHLLFGLLLSAVLFPAESRSDDFFESRIRPLLLKHCVECHGADKQESGLRLDSREGWSEGGDGGPAIVPGDPTQSLLIHAVQPANDSIQMPPDGDPLSGEEIADLVSWVKAGAVDPRIAAVSATSSEAMNLDAAKTFWSFRPVTKPPTPSVHSGDQALNPIDLFIQAEREEHELTALETADKRTLLRRATFDLLGLPPTPAQSEAFLNDTSPMAFATLINELLQSPAYGERWGRHWLDIARYADTAGDGADYPVREAFKYRDWVVRSFNQDLPYDQFVREQIAGDLLAEDSPAEEYADKVIATGFLAIGKRYGYAPNKDFQHLDFADLIDSVGRSILGLSIGCARCHDHKFDPISAADYYALYGIFESSNWAFPGGESVTRPVAMVPLVPPAEAARRDALKAEKLAQINERMNAVKSELAHLEDQQNGGGADLGWENHTIDKPPAKPWFTGGPNKVLADAQSPFHHVYPPGTRGVHVGASTPGDGIRYGFGARALRAGTDKKIHFTIDFRTESTATEKGAYRFFLGRGIVQSIAMECSITTNEIAIRSGNEWEVVRALEPGVWYTLQVSLDHAAKTYSGTVGTIDDLTSFVDRPIDSRWDGVADTFLCDAKGHVDGQAPSRDIDNIALRDVPFEAPGSGPITLPPADPDSEARIAALTEKLTALTKVHAEADSDQPYPLGYAVVDGTPTDTALQKRGEPKRLGEKIPRRFLEVLGGDVLSPDSSGSGRLELSDWLTRPSNPLTARVFVNRVWQWHFGQGLVTTPSDFGSRGQPPSHPELLDWLTSEFIESGWSVKSLHRLIMNSQTYSLASGEHPQNRQIDPANRWLWRYPRRPLDAESIRDAVLAISGELDSSVAKQHPFPPINTWKFTIHRPFHAVYDSNHRSLYLMVQRNQRHPFLAMFDAADPNVSVATRLPTTTPTQSLFLMNSPFVHEKSEAFATRLLNLQTDDTARIQWSYQNVFGRVASDQEIVDAQAFLEKYQSQLASSSEPSTSTATKAWAAFARVLLSSNEFLYVD